VTERWRKSPFDPTELKRAKPDPVLRRVPTDEEFSKLIAEVRKPSWKVTPGKHGGQRPQFQPESADFLEFEGLAGVGQAEAANLEWEHIDWKRNRIRYVRCKTHTEFHTPLYSWVRPLLARLHEEARLANGGTEPKGNVFKIDDPKHALTSACKRAKLPQFSQRNLRAYLIGRLWKAGVDMKLISQWQGHRDGGKLIMDTYTEVFGSNDASYEAAQLAKAEASCLQISG
jgi:integrase